MMLSANRTKRSTKSNRRRGIRRTSWPIFTPRLELLEDRTLPSTVNWINPAGGDWDTAGNWQDSLGVNRVPGATDDVVISQSGITVTHTAGVTDSVNSLTSQAAINITGGTLALAATSQINAALTLAYSSGIAPTLVSGGDLTVTGLFTWAGDAILQGIGGR
jgi:hypothetical protein